MSLFQDLKPAFTKNQLTFIEKHPETGNIVSFIFKSNKPISWKAGQHGIFSFPQKLEGGSWRGFSVASYPGEGVIRISTRILEKPSAYKRALMDLKPGERITMRGPVGPFYLDCTQKPVVFIAGGIGITPYRSLILNSAVNKSEAPSSIRLLYSDNTRQYAYRQELDEIASKNDLIQIEYLTSEELPGSITSCVHDWNNEAYYYISGPGKMVQYIKKSLMEQGISKRNVKHEMFLGL